MSIWKTKLSLDEINAFSQETMVSHIGIRIIEIGDDYLKASMPVDKRTHRPQGILHGGASVALAETVGSIAAYMCAKPGSNCVGLEINANHIKTIKEGTVYGVARPIHIGRSTQVWDIRVSDDLHRTISVCRLTVAVLS